ncbi:aspartate kinase [Chytriomyces confervae]|uniref:Glycylpeptide N-tetradecanoyltransferase n=1 Tax=Chytriomyces confervae TaxID=246404 RepID=A0A507DM01_9FUNG|nr:aspartate kinase [Chytriomyces confervae]
MPFWKTQPVQSENEHVNALRTGPIGFAAEAVDLRLTSYLEWVFVDLENERDLDDVHDLLLFNYVQDDAGRVRLCCSKEALLSPGFNKEFHIGLRHIQNKQLVGFIGGTPTHLFVDSLPVHSLEVNFLCLDKCLRGKNLAPILIQKMVQVMNQFGFMQALYSGGSRIHSPILSARYYSLLLAPFQNGLANSSFRPLEKRDSCVVHEMLSNYLNKFRIRPQFTVKDIEHWCDSTATVVLAYVEEDPKTQQIVQFISFFILPATVINGDTQKVWKSVYLFYYVPKSSLDQDFVLLLRDALTIVSKEGHDAVNCLDVMDNNKFIHSLDFQPSAQNLHYFFYNFEAKIDPEDCGIVFPVTIVTKFGGTSVGWAERMLQIADIINYLSTYLPTLTHWANDRRIVVLSAMSSYFKAEGTTSMYVFETLLEAADDILLPNSTLYLGIVSKIEANHLKAVAEGVKNDQICKLAARDVSDACEKLRSFMSAAEIIDEISPRSRDVIISVGEKLSARILSAILQDQVRLICFLQLLSDYSKIVCSGYQLAFLISSMDPNCVPVVTGYLGPIPGSIVTTIGRGYTDLTAALIAVGLKARELQIWKEVDGIFTADPRKAPRAYLLSSISRRINVLWI